MSGPLDISLKDELLFIKSLLIPAFDPDNELDSSEKSKKRKEWLKTRGEQKKWNLDVLAELIERYGTVKSLKEAERKLEEVKAERLLEKAEDNERKQGKSSIICSHSSFFALFLSFPVCCHLVFLHVDVLCCCQRYQQKLSRPSPLSRFSQDLSSSKTILTPATG